MELQLWVFFFKHIFNWIGSPYLNYLKPTHRIDPDAWTTDYKQCGGHLQSPISLNPFTAQYVNYSDFIFGNYDKVAPMNITNNGHSGTVQ